MSASDPQSFNRYSYVENDPLNRIDPSGLEESLTCYVDGVPMPSCGAMAGLLGSGAGVVGPLDATRFNYQTGRLETFHAFADGFSGWIPQGATYGGDGVVLHDFAGFDEGAFDLQRDHSVSPFLDFGGERNFGHGEAGGGGRTHKPVMQGRRATDIGKYYKCLKGARDRLLKEFTERENKIKKRAIRNMIIGMIGGGVSGKRFPTLNGGGFGMLFGALAVAIGNQDQLDDLMEELDNRVKQAKEDCAKEAVILVE